MEAFILILITNYGYSGGVATQEFPNRQSCMAAVQQIEKDLGRWNKPILATCVKKDVTQ